MIKCILFDFDGTIIDSDEIIIKALEYTVREVTGNEPDMDKIYSSLGLILLDQMKILAPCNPELAVEKYKSFYREHMDSMTGIFPNVVNTLKELKKLEIKNAVVSNKGIHGINHGLDKFKLRDYFDAVVSAYDVENNKPHPEPAYKALKMLDAKPEQSLLIGDSPNDIRCGINAGIKTVLVGWTIYPDKGFTGVKADYTINDFREILDIVSL
jgi:pyrophosphatase PpaX